MSVNNNTKPNTHPPTQHEKQNYTTQQSNNQSQHTPTFNTNNHTTQQKIHVVAEKEKFYIVENDKKEPVNIQYVGQNDIGVYKGGALTYLVRRGDGKASKMIKGCLKDSQSTPKSIIADNVHGKQYDHYNVQEQKVIVGSVDAHDYDNHY